MNLEIEHELIFSRRKSLAFQVTPAGRLIIRAPQGMSRHVIKQHLLSHDAWIQAKRDKFLKDRVPSPPVDFTDGACFGYLGKDMTLRVVSQQEQQVRVQETLLYVMAPNPDPVRIKRLVTGWLERQARDVLQQRLKAAITKTKRLGISHDGSFCMKPMTSKWGSCTSDGRITLNSYLICAPLACIDYVILHELCHLKELNHSKKFYALLQDLMPDWKNKRERLNKIRI